MSSALITTEKPLIETFHLYQGKIRNASFHARRMLATGRALGFVPPPWQEIETLVSTVSSEEILRCTVTYRTCLESLCVVPYRIKKWNALQLIPLETNIYSHKWADRQVFALYESMMEEGVLPLFVRHGCLTDTVYTHLVLEDTSGNLVTPDTYLLKGTMREYLLQNKVVQEKRVTPSDLYHYRWIHLINAMMLPGENRLPVERILIY